MIKEISDIIEKWYKEHHRDLPWRNTKDPYQIWISEIILQQTRVDQGLPYFQNFILHFPSVSDLSAAHEDQILKLWQGLGYYSRARNLHRAALYIQEQCNGRFPDTIEGLLKLPGIGQYTAAAIGSFAFDLPEPVMDGNVQRVIARLFGIETEVSTAKGKNELMSALLSVFNKDEPALFNQSIMEFGALQCVPRNPDCQHCPLQWKCAAYEKGMVMDLPVKKAKQKVKTRYLNYFIPVYKEHTFLEKRTGSGIWKNLYQFPLYESTDDAGWTEGTTGLVSALSIGNEDLIGNMLTDETRMTHLLSHQRLEIRFVTVRLSKPVTPDKDRFTATPVNGILSNFAVPRIIEKFVTEAGWG